MHRLIDYFYLFSAIACAVYSQAIIRWRLGLSPEMPENFYLKAKFISTFLIQPWVLSSIVATFFAGILWIISLSKFELNYAYPWMAMIFILMLFVGAFFFEESINLQKILGTILVVIGLIVVARS